jgi:hypothetical protein
MGIVKSYKFSNIVFETIVLVFFFKFLYNIKLINN